MAWFKYWFAFVNKPAAWTGSRPKLLHKESIINSKQFSDCINSFSTSRLTISTPSEGLGSFLLILVGSYMKLFMQYLHLQYVIHNERLVWGLHWWILNLLLLLSF